MKQRPFWLFLSSCLFLYLPGELVWRWLSHAAPIHPMDIVFSFILPFLLMVGLIRVSRVGWYTLVALVALWGVKDLYDYYSTHSRSLYPLMVHLGIYCVSLGYFINPRVRHLYFDPKSRWWRTKPRYETHLPFLFQTRGDWHYPILRNISEGGCFIETPHLLEVNSPIHITIPLPVPLSVSVIKTQGEVRWVSTNPLRQGMGVQFLHPAPEHFKAIKQYVNRQL